MRSCFALVALAACYQPRFEECAVKCGQGNACPAGWACGGDGFCWDSAQTRACAGGDGGIAAGTCPAGMLFVPGGPGLMGSVEVDGGLGDSDEFPQHTVTLSPFCIDHYEVTVGAYRACVSAGGCLEAVFTDASCTWFLPDAGAGEMPMTCASWEEARTYCTWAGGRLPTEAEWERAARGTIGQTYPWGEETPTCARANYLACGGGPLPVGGRSPAGDSPYGAGDMAGNAAEWVQDFYAANAYDACAAGCVDPTGPTSGSMRVRRGGHFLLSDPTRVRTTDRVDDTTAGGVFIGFRCRAEPTP